MRAGGLAALVTLAALATGCGATVATTSGTALVAPGTSGGVTNTVRLYDRGGPVSRTILRTVAALGAASAAVDHVERTSTSYTAVECSGGSCAEVTYTTTTTTTYVDPAKAAAAAAAYQRFSDQIAATPYRDFPFETVLDIASRDLGGDTSGWNVWFWYHGSPRPVGAVGLALSAGLAGGHLHFHDRTRTTLAGTSAAVVPVTEQLTAEHAYVGTPVRVTMYLRGNLSLYVQPDLNWASTLGRLSGDEVVDANPWRLGARARLGRFELGAELVTDGMSVHARSLGAEVGLVY
ncbi:MAG: hypothetical protein R3B06_15565 [Kofleriaceae bacterium]